MSSFASPRNLSPIFIGGLYKSGTSLLRAMLGRHSHIAAGLETFWFDMNWSDLGSGRREYLGRREDGSRDEPLEAHLTRLSSFYEIELHELQALLAKSGSAEDFLDRFLGAYAKREGKARWLEKTPANIMHTSRILNHWPKASVIHLLRNPRDVYASMREAGKWNTASDFARLWVSFMDAADRSKNEARDAGSEIMEITYEDLVMATEETLREVLTFVGEDWEEGLGGFDGQERDYWKVLAVTGKRSSTLARLREPLSRARIGIGMTAIPDSEWSDVVAAVHGLHRQDVLEKVFAMTERGAAS